MSKSLKLCQNSFESACVGPRGLQAVRVVLQVAQALVPGHVAAAAGARRVALQAVAHLGQLRSGERQPGGPRGGAQALTRRALKRIIDDEYDGIGPYI